MPFPSYPLPLFQNESTCETIQMKMSLILHENRPVGETHFHMNGFAPRLVLNQRQRVTRKWPIFLVACKATNVTLAFAKNIPRATPHFCNLQCNKMLRRKLQEKLNFPRLSQRFESSCYVWHV